MNGYLTIALGAGCSAALGLGAFRHLGRTLRPILAELCGSETRAAFWLSFSELILVLTPTVWSLMWAEFGRGNTPQDLFAQVRAGLWGLLLAVGGLGLVLSRFALEERP